MKTSPWLVGVAVVFWGRQAGLYLPAIAMAVVLEASRRLPWRWDLDDDDFNRVVDVCNLLVAAVAIYLTFTRSGAEAVILVLQSLPMLVFPLVATQAYSTRGTVNVHALLIALRSKAAMEAGRQLPRVDVSAAYVAICVVGASAANVRTGEFYLGLVAIAAWACWPFRARRHSPARWALTLLAAAGVGYAGHVGLHALRNSVEGRMVRWLADSLTSDPNPFKARTAIGEIGELKLSSTIQLRVEVESGHEFDGLLHEASYNIYRGTSWFTSRPTSVAVYPQEDGTSWRLGRPEESDNAVLVEALLRNGRGVLKLPHGAYRVERLPAGSMEKNRYGSVELADGPGLAHYRVRFKPTAALAGPPSDSDLGIPAVERPALAAVLASLEATSNDRSPAATVKRVTEFFGEQFGYSLDVTRPASPATSPLADFLLRRRSGHCEYFATATTLLLRMAGIPARYATGYAVYEADGGAEQYVVRGRHAHAWTLAHIDGAWRAVDTTPPAWRAAEDQRADWTQAVSDFWTTLRFAVSRWRWREQTANSRQIAVGLLAALVLVAAYRLRARKPVQRVVARKVDGRQRPDAEFDRIEERLAELGLARNPSEPLRPWLHRIEPLAPPTVAIAALHPLVELHYGWRFDPAGLPPAARERLRAESRDWLEQHRAGVRCKR